MATGQPHVVDVDAFDLPDWLGTEEVVWTAGSSVRGEHHIAGDLSGPDGSTSCDLLAADQAFPMPVLDDTWRRAAHQAWTRGEVLLVEYDGRLTLAVPGTEFTADDILETMTRLAKAVGVKPNRFVVALRP